MEGKTEEEVERYAKVFKERYKELNGTANVPIEQSFCMEISFACFIYPAI